VDRKGFQFSWWQHYTRSDYWQVKTRSNFKFAFRFLTCLLLCFFVSLLPPIDIDAKNTQTPAMRIALLCLIASSLLPSSTSADDVPVLAVTHHESSIKFYVKASVALAGKFDRWKSTLTFTSPDVTTGVLDITIESDSVDTGSGMKNGKLKGEKFFDVKNNPTITFHSTKIVQTSPTAFEVDGDFTIRGVSNPEKLTLTLPATGKGLEHIDGKMVFDRKDYGMKSGIPFIKIADHVEVTIHLAAKQTGGPPLLFKHPVA
jgi:polyisoprenoid-binding protein YceI